MPPPPDGGCGDDTATITDRAVAVAMLIRQRDGSFLSVRGTLAAIAREGRAIAVGDTDDTPGARLAGMAGALDLAMLSLDAAESAWAESSTLIAELVDSAATSRGLAAAARALSLQTTSQYLAQSDDPRAAAGARLVLRSAGMSAASAARFEPALIVEQPTVLDLEFTPDDSPRRAAVAALIASLEGQLPMLEQLYDARASREAAFPAASNAEADPLREAFGQRADGLWSRLAHAARQLGERDLEEWRHAWAWTEIGTIRDRLLPLEAALSQIEQDALWTATGDVTAFDDAVDRQWLLMAAIEDARTSEAGHTAELQRSAEKLIAPAAEAMADLARLVGAGRQGTVDDKIRDFLTVAEGVLGERAAALGEAEALRRELRAGLPTGDYGPPLSFSQASLTLAGVRDLERLLAGRAVAEHAVLGIAQPRAASDRDAALLEVAYLLDLPVTAFRRGNDVTLTLRWGETAFATSIPVGPGQQASATTASTHRAAQWAAFRGADAWRGHGQPAIAAPTWSGTQSPPSLIWAAVPTSSADGAYDNFHLQPPTMPPGWVAEQQRAQQNKTQTLEGQIDKAMRGNMANYGLGVTLVAVGGCSGLWPIAGAGGWILASNLGKDTLTGSAKAVNQAYGSTDPRVRAAMDRQIDKARGAVDALGILTGSMSANIGADLIDPFFSTIGGLGGAMFGSSPPPPTDPYLDRINEADALVQQAFAAAKLCQWPKARDLINQARAKDPHGQCYCWRKIGYRVIELANKWDGDLEAAKNTLAFARKRAHDEVYGCGLRAANLPARLAREYKNQARWACDTRFDREMLGLHLLGERLEGIENSLAVAEASCDRAEATGLARQVIAWADANTQPYACAPTMRAAAETVLTWATQPLDGTVQVLTDARTAIDRCELDRAQKLLDAPAPPSRCPEEGIAPGATEDTRRELRRLLERRRADTARFTQLEQDAEIMLESCDQTAMQNLLAELGRLDPCLDDQTGTAGIESRRHAIAERLRRSLDLASEGTLTQIDQVKDLLNDAILAADTACDMQPARTKLDRVTEILKVLWLSPCARAIFVEEIDAVSRHATYVEQRVDERAAVLAGIRADFDAADAAFKAALQGCSEAGLDRAAAMLEAAAGGISALPIMTHSSCQAITRLRDVALESRDEALTLKVYWAGIDADLENARRIAAEGRGIGIDVYCAGVRQKAHPASCFQAELAECDRLSPSDPPIGSGTANVVPPPPAPPPGGGSGSSGGGSGRVQLDDPEPCARDVSWSPARQRFECTCPGYRLDENLGRCLPGTTTAATLSQANCDAQYPGTRLATDPETGLPACLCPIGTAWSGTHGRCLELMVAGGVPAGRMSCDPAMGGSLIREPVAASARWGPGTRLSAVASTPPPPTASARSRPAKRPPSVSGCTRRSSRSAAAAAQSTGRWRPTPRPKRKAWDATRVGSTKPSHAATGRCSRSRAVDRAAPGRAPAVQAMARSAGSPPVASVPR